MRIARGYRSTEFSRNLLLISGDGFVCERFGVTERVEGNRIQTKSVERTSNRQSLPWTRRKGLKRLDGTTALAFCDCSRHRIGEDLLVSSLHSVENCPRGGLRRSLRNV